MQPALTTRRGPRRSAILMAQKKQNKVPVTNAGVCCLRCGAQAPEQMANCPTCGSAVGFPNVRHANSADETQELNKRYAAARKAARSRGLHKQLDAVRDTITARSHVVVAVPPIVAQSLLVNRNSLYSNYEEMVGGSLRTAAPFDDDSDRKAVGGKLFGSFAKDIRYGVLSIDGRGVSSYGCVFLRLREVVVSHRVSFLETNSYVFLDTYASGFRKKLPTGYRSTWETRGTLAATKLAGTIKVGEPIDIILSRLVCSAADRSKDDFIEAHIFGTFNADGIQSIESDTSALSRQDKNTVRAIHQLFKKMERGTGP